MLADGRPDATTTLCESPNTGYLERYAERCRSSVLGSHITSSSRIAEASLPLPEVRDRSPIISSSPYQKAFEVGVHVQYVVQ